MNGMIEWWARNTVAANLLMIGIILAGMLGYNRMEREIFPTISFSGVNINIQWPGASPREIEEQIIVRIEEAVSDLDNVVWVFASAQEGQAEVNIRTTTDVDFAQFMNDVKNRVDGISTFPRDIEPPRVVQWRNGEEYISVALSGVPDERERTRLASDLREEMASLPAISLVEPFGIRKEEVSVEVSEEALRRYNLSFADVADAIRVSSINLSSGLVRTDAGIYALSVRNIADTQSEFENIIIRQIAGGATVRVGDVATVVDGFEDQPILATLDGEPAVLLQVLSTEYMNITRAAEGVVAWIENRSKTLPEGAKLTLWRNGADTFNARISTISGAALQGLVLVLIVLVLTLRPIVALWVTVGIATAYAGAFILLPGLGISLNMLSTFAFLLVLGIVVDDAIVVGESIHTESGRTGGGMTAAVFGTQLVAKPVIFAVLTTILAFTPWLLMDGETSEFTRHITWVVICALSFSLVESLLILPAHLSKLKPRQRLTAFDRVQKRVARAILNFAQYRYRAVGEWVVQRPYTTLASFMAILIIAFTLMSAGYVKSSFDPVVESEEVFINVTMPDGNTYKRSLEVLRQLQDGQRALVAEFQAQQEAAGSDAKLIRHWYTRSRRDTVLAIVKLTPPEERGNVSAKTVALRLRELIGEVPDAQEFTINYQLDGQDAGFEIAVDHADVEVLRAASEDLMQQLRTYSALYDIRSDLQASTQEIQLAVKPGAQQLGLTLADISRQVRQAYFGEEVQRLPRDGDDVRVMVRYPQEARENIESLEDFRIRTADGREVPLMAVAELSFAPGINRINRFQRKRSARISADLADDVRGEIMADLEKNFFPGWRERYPGVDNEAVGEAEEERRFVNDVLSLYTVTFFVMYMLLAIAFRSYAQPALFLVAIPFAFVGAIFGHLATGVTMNILSYFGIAAAAGVVINDNLVLIDCCNRLRERGMNAAEAIVEAGVARFRPILLTTVTTIVGLIPMMLEKSTQAAFLKPIVIALMFGVGIALFVTLMMVPSMYIIGGDISRGAHWLKKRSWDRIKARFGGEEEVPAQAE